MGEPTPMPVFDRVTKIEVSAVPFDLPGAHHFSLWVELRSEGRFCVSNGFSEVLDVDGDWVWESRPSERGDDFIARTRYDLETAMAMARAAAPSVTVNGFSVEDGIRMAIARKERADGRG